VLMHKEFGTSIGFGPVTASLSAMVIVATLGEPRLAPEGLLKVNVNVSLPFGIGIVSEWNVDGLECFTGRKVNCANRGRVITARGSVAINQVAVVRRRLYRWSRNPHWLPSTCRQSWVTVMVARPDDPKRDNWHY